MKYLPDAAEVGIHVYDRGFSFVGELVGKMCCYCADADATSGTEYRDYFVHLPDQIECKIMHHKDNMTIADQNDDLGIRP